LTGKVLKILPLFLQNTRLFVKMQGEREGFGKKMVAAPAFLGANLL